MYTYGQETKRGSISSEKSLQKNSPALSFFSQLKKLKSKYPMLAQKSSLDSTGSKEYINDN